MLAGVYVTRPGADGKTLTFLRLPAPTDEEVYEVAERTAERTCRLLVKRGSTINGLSSGDGGSALDPALEACYDVAA